MNKAEMIEKVAKITGLTQKDAKSAVDAIFETEPGRGIIASELDGDGKVTVRDRDSMDQERVSADGLRSFLRDRLEPPA